jgi:hypothetical protein
VGGRLLLLATLLPPGSLRTFWFVGTPHAPVGLCPCTPGRITRPVVEVFVCWDGPCPGWVPVMSCSGAGLHAGSDRTLRR